MLVTIDQGTVDIRVDFEAAISVAIEPGVWTIQHRGQTFAITRLRGRLLEGRLHFIYPKGVPLKHAGRWSGQERILVDALPHPPAAAWATLPDAIRSALEDAYLLARHELPEQLEQS